MKKLTLLLMALFFSATLYGSQMFKGNVNINISGGDAFRFKCLPSFYC